MEMVDMGSEFVAYMGVAVVLFAIREMKKVPNIYIPIVAIVIGVIFAFWEYKNFEFQTFLTGLQYALMGIGTVAGVRYFLETRAESETKGRNLP